MTLQYGDAWDKVPPGEYERVKFACSPTPVSTPSSATPANAPTSPPGCPVSRP
jgi:hypothetical protein